MAGGKRRSRGERPPSLPTAEVAAVKRSSRGRSQLNTFLGVTLIEHNGAEQARAPRQQPFVVHIHIAGCRI